jgi:4-amino-4-deoxychorismate lyase
MPLLVETIRADDGLFEDPGPHLERMARSRSALFGAEAPLNLRGALEQVSTSIGEGRWKLRVLYDTEIRRVEAALYVPKPYCSAALVDGGSIKYPHKTADRPELDKLTRRAVSAGAETALIVSGGRITDFSYANAAFFDGRLWWTPAQPLLPGTRRARLLTSGKILEANITPGNLDRYVSVSPINAMLDLGEVLMDIGSIRKLEIQ